MLCIRRTLAQGRLSGFISGLGAATADALYGSMAALGLTAISSMLVEQQTWLRMVGGLFLCFLGIRTFLTKPSFNSKMLVTGAVPPTGLSPSTLPSSEFFSETPAIQMRSLLPNYLSTLFLTLTNPLTILSFVAIFSGLGIVSAGRSGVQALSMVAGVFLGSTAWWFLLSALANALRLRFLTTSGMRWINRLSGAIILGFGVAALWGIRNVI